ncbi:MAG: glycosyltransferase [Candidatus Undinarchaeales archaeon]|jgi:hypothetical protein|nr:glycosyltransferase [Candidatus Undinarchaeales archaeon]MDP7492058.1 glycosyltransferase [Candidatus Undinarchaeales archaeon]
MSDDVADDRPSVSIVIPCHNEERNVERAVTETLGSLGGLDLEVLVEEDGSTDRTAEIARSLAEGDPRIRVLSFPEERLGKGGGFARAAGKATKDVIVLMDADLAVHPREVLRALDRMQGGVAMVIGSREVAGSKRMVDQTPARRVAGKAFSLLVRTMFWLPFNDLQCGFKVMRREVIETTTLTHLGWEFDTELIWKALRAGFTVEEMGVHWTEGGDSRLRIYPDAFNMLWGLILLRLGR